MLIQDAKQMLGCPRIDQLNENHIDVFQDEKGNYQVRCIKKNGQRTGLLYTLSNCTMGGLKYTEYGWSTSINPSAEDYKHTKRVQEIIRQKMIALETDPDDRVMREYETKKLQLYTERPVPEEKLDEYRKRNNGRTTYNPSAYVAADKTFKESKSGVMNEPIVSMFDANGDASSFMEFKEWGRQKMSMVGIQILYVYRAKTVAKGQSPLKFKQVFKFGQAADTLPMGLMDFNTIGTASLTTDEKKNTETKEAEPVTSSSTQGGPNTYKSQVSDTNSSSRKRSAIAANIDSASTKKRARTST